MVADAPVDPGGDVSPLSALPRTLLAPGRTCASLDGDCAQGVRRSSPALVGESERGQRRPAAYLTVGFTLGSVRTKVRPLGVKRRHTVERGWALAPTTYQRACTLYGPRPQRYCGNGQPPDALDGRIIDNLLFRD